MQTSIPVDSSPSAGLVYKKVDNYFILHQFLGKGQFSEVYKAVNQEDSSKVYAAKIIPLKQHIQFANITELLKQEIGILKKVRHENLVCMHDLKQSPNNLYIFLDFCDGGDLRNHLAKNGNSLPENTSLEIFRQLCAGYKALYQAKVIHRDLKPENIFLHQGKVKIGDFGFARGVQDTDEAMRMTLKCSPLYAPPQILMNEIYSSKCDVWSMGCILYEMIFGIPPFTAFSLFTLVQNIKTKVSNGPYQLPTTKPIAKEVAQLIQHMIMFDEKKRASWEQVFSHPVVTGAVAAVTAVAVVAAAVAVDQPQNKGKEEEGEVKQSDEVEKQSKQQTTKYITEQPSTQSSSQQLRASQQVTNPESSNASSSSDKLRVSMDSTQPISQPPVLRNRTTTQQLKQSQITCNTTSNTSSSSREQFEDQLSQQQAATPSFERSQPEPLISENIQPLVLPFTTDQSNFPSQINALEEISKPQQLNVESSSSNHKRILNDSNSNNINTVALTVPSQKVAPSFNNLPSELSPVATISSEQRASSPNQHIRPSSPPQNPTSKTIFLTPSNRHLRTQNAATTISGQQQTMSLSQSTALLKPASNRYHSSSVHRYTPRQLLQKCLPQPVTQVLNVQGEHEKSNNPSVQTNQALQQAVKVSARKPIFTSNENRETTQQQVNERVLSEQIIDVDHSKSQQQSLEKLIPSISATAAVSSKLQDKATPHLVKNIDAFFRFMQRRAEFANSTLLAFWDSKLIFTSSQESLSEKVVLLCLLAYYYQGLEFLRRILALESEPKMIKKEGFNEYLNSQEYVFTKNIIDVECSQARELFQDISPVLVKDISIVQGLQKILQLATSQSLMQEELRLECTPFIALLIDSVEIDDNTRMETLLGIHMLQVFSQIEVHAPIYQFSFFNFTKFLDDNLHNATAEKLRKAIKQKRQISQ